jgi:hypothetical protein
VCSTPSRTKNTDQSAKRKSARVLFEQSEDESWDGADRLAEEILEERGGRRGDSDARGKRDKSTNITMVSGITSRIIQAGNTDT